MIYLDNAASTMIREEVLKEMSQVLRKQYGNPSSIHMYGRAAEKIVSMARRHVATLICAKPYEILFTSGGTESNNTAIRCSIQDEHAHIITTSIEHDAVLEPCHMLERSGYNVTYVAPEKSGIVNVQDIINAMTEKTRLVSIMLANNEVGTIQPIQQISKECKKRNILLHTDAVQAVGKIPINVTDLGVDLLSMSSHKINGPKGVGALYVRHGIKLDPMILGGGQEKGLRSGTENVSSIAGFGVACKMTYENLERETSHIMYLRERLVEKICSEISYTLYNGDAKKRTCNNAHFTFLGINGEDLIIKLDEYGIAASTGSACSVRIQKASHVLLAMGFSYEQITGSLRLSLGIFNTKEEVDRTVDVLKKAITELRAVSPLKSKYNF
ncbi:MAG: cysteine desulfurase [Cenarchaeum symbiont of Oopsacas minuta]|nr:cysteine desulfurase [Cenarchaeum symbiont of Oopsacas minuta]MDI1496362.1 cysteine desulfurase [Cenarchaeum symbiont of Oopsacas minuta]